MINQLTKETITTQGGPHGFDIYHNGKLIVQMTRPAIDANFTGNLRDPTIDDLTNPNYILDSFLNPKTYLVSNKWLDDNNIKYIAKHVSYKDDYNEKIQEEWYRMIHVNDYEKVNTYAETLEKPKPKDQQYYSDLINQLNDVLQYHDLKLEKPTINSMTKISYNNEILMYIRNDDQLQKIIEDLLSWEYYEGRIPYEVIKNISNHKECTYHGSHQPRLFYELKPEVFTWLRENDIKFRINYITPSGKGLYVNDLFIINKNDYFKFKLRWF